MVFLSDVSRDRDNNYNLIRFLAAGAVLVSHAFPISSGPETRQPLQDTLDMGLGHLGVLIFFVISGLLITQSFDRSSTVTSFLVARALRLFPALIVVLILTVIGLGPIATTLPPDAYATAPETLTYLPRNLSLAFLQYDLPGVFVDNPYPGAINGSLWTLVHEVTCYVGVLLLGLLGAIGDRRRLAVGMAAYLAFYLAVSLGWTPLASIPRLVSLKDLSLPFVLGGLFYVYRAYLPLSIPFAAVLAAIVFVGFDTPVGEELFVLSVSYTTIVLAYRVGGVMRRYNDLGDYSYGVYIYAFPVQQTIAWQLGPHSPYLNIILAAPVTLALAILSWNLIESRALKLKTPLSSRILAFRTP